jgi:hypothetical protein
MGAVYRVCDTRSGKRVALKRLRHQEASAESRSLFEREFHTLSQLAHPRIIEVYDYGIDDAGAYYTMELLDGHDLREDGQLPWREACTVLCDVASSLAILHSRRLVHRDVSPRNVRRTGDGRAKLLDFGAMAAMGLPKRIVGTPACVAPENLQLQALDGRADLYSLGVVAYWALTNHFPYPARTLRELPELWLKPFLAPHVLVPEIPVALSQLVMQLLSLERSGRPASAAEVMERLSAVASIEPDRHDDVSLAYLTTPVLVGRDALVLEARRCLTALQEGSGSTLVLVGDRGSGRTHALDACVLEARLSGAIALRADASDARFEDYGVVRALGRQLIEELPETATRAAALQRPLLGQVIEELRSGHEVVAPAERRNLLAALRDWLLTVARSHRLVFAVDDVDAIDEPSSALLAAVAHGAGRHGVMIAVTRQREAPKHRAIEILEEHAVTFALTPLSAEQTEMLVHSVFGDVDQVVGVAHRIFEVSQGNPRDAMELIHHLVQRGRARHEVGGWLLPSEVRDSDLPRSLTVALTMRLEALDGDARELAEALSVTDARWVSLEDYAELTEHGDAARVFQALSALVASGILISEGNRHRFAQRAWPSLLDERMTNEHKRELHARLARIALRREDPYRRLHHLMSSGQEQAAIDELITRIGTDALDYSAETLRLLEHAIVAAERLAAPQRSRLILELRAVGVSSLTSDYDRFLRYMPRVLERLRRDSGLSDWAELDDELPQPERLQRAVMGAQARYEATPEAERGFPPFESVKRLARLYAAFAAMSGTAQEPDLLLQLPSLTPFAPFSPAAAVIQQLIDGELALEQGRLERTRSLFLKVLERIAQADGAGLEPAYREQIRYSLTFIVATLEARCGLPSALAWSDELEKVPRHRANAWRARRAYYRLQGELEQAKRCQRQIELLELQDGPQPFQNASYRIELLSCWLSDDLLGVKSFFEPLEEQARRFPRLRVMRQLAHCHYHRIRGEYQHALDELAPALELAEPARHIDWQYVAAAHVELLTLLGRSSEARHCSERYLAICEREQLIRAWRGIEHSTILALVAAHELDEARRRCDELIALEAADGVTGTIMTLCYAARARVAVAMHDAAAFERFTELCAEHCRRTDNPALRALHERLLQEARDAGMGATTPSYADEAADTSEPGADSAMDETAANRLTECVDAAERARCALTLLLETMSSEQGFLFGVRNGVLQPIAAVPEHDAPDDLRAHLEVLIKTELESGGATMTIDAAQFMAATEATHTHKELAEMGFAPVMLFTRRDVDVVIAAVAAVASPAGRRPTAPASLLDTIAVTLIGNADVDPVTCFVS